MMLGTTAARRRSKKTHLEARPRRAGYVKSGVFAPLRVANYRWLSIGQFVLILGTRFAATQIAMADAGLYGVGLENVQMGLMLGSHAAPGRSYTDCLHGVYVDRWDRRRTMIWADWPARRWSQ